MAASPRRPRTSGTSGKSQIRYWGENTLLKAMYATTAAADAATISSGPAAPRANQIQTARSATTTATPESVAARSAPGVTRLSEP